MLTCTWRPYFVCVQKIIDVYAVDIGRFCHDKMRIWYHLVINVLEKYHIIIGKLVSNSRNKALEIYSRYVYIAMNIFITIVNTLSLATCIFNSMFSCPAGFHWVEHSVFVEPCIHFDPVRDSPTYYLRYDNIAIRQFSSRLCRIIFMYRDTERITRWFLSSGWNVIYALSNFSWSISLPFFHPSAICLDFHTLDHFPMVTVL